MNAEPPAPDPDLEYWPIGKGPGRWEFAFLCVMGAILTGLLVAYGFALFSA